MRRRKGDCMNIDNKTSLENNKDEWESFEEKEFSLDFFRNWLNFLEKNL